MVPVPHLDDPGSVFRNQSPQTLFLKMCQTGLLVYFLYGIRHSKEGDLSHAVLMTSSEANKVPWGAVIGGETTVVRVKATRGRNATDEDKAALIDDDE